MGGHRIPGPTCRPAEGWSIEDGTLARWLTPRPGPVCTFSPLLQPFRPDPQPDLGFLFNACSNPDLGLSESDYADAAKTLGVEVAVIKAVAAVESPRGAFDANGRPEILFERHYFHRLTHGKYDKKYSDISKSSAGGYGKFSAQYLKLERAYGLDRTAALKSTSWGRFQIMGTNYRAAGFSSVDGFVFAMTKSEAAHLQAFVSFVKSDSAMTAALRKKDWPAFAKHYNGSQYKKNNYDDKIKTEYERIIAESRKHSEAPQSLP